jgi:hypothetical protein
LFNIKSFNFQSNIINNRTKPPQSDAVKKCDAADKDFLAKRIALTEERGAIELTLNIILKKDLGQGIEDRKKKEKTLVDGRKKVGSKSNTGGDGSGKEGYETNVEIESQDAMDAGEEDVDGPVVAVEEGHGEEESEEESEDEDVNDVSLLQQRKKARKVEKENEAVETDLAAALDGKDVEVVEESSSKKVAPVKPANPATDKSFYTRISDAEMGMLLTGLDADVADSDSKKLSFLQENAHGKKHMKAKHMTKKMKQMKRTHRMKHKALLKKHMKKHSALLKKQQKHHKIESLRKDAESQQLALIEFNVEEAKGRRELEAAQKADNDDENEDEKTQYEKDLHLKTQTGQLGSALDKLLKETKEKARQEVKSHERCVSELTEVRENLKTQNTNEEEFTNGLSEAQTKGKNARKEEKTLGNEIQDLQQSLAFAIQERNLERKEFQKFRIEMNMIGQGLAAAIHSLKEHFENPEIDQNPHESDIDGDGVSDASAGKTGGNSKAAQNIISMLTKIREENSIAIMKAEKENEDAEVEIEEFSKMTNKTVAAKRKSQLDTSMSAARFEETSSELNPPVLSEMT